MNLKKVFKICVRDGIMIEDELTKMVRISDGYTDCVCDAAFRLFGQPPEVWIRDDKFRDELFYPANMLALQMWYKKNDIPFKDRQLKKSLPFLWALSNAHGGGECPD